MGKVWVLDTETKGTGAEMVPLEKVLADPDSKPKRRPRRPAARRAEAPAGAELPKRKAPVQTKVTPLPPGHVRKKTTGEIGKVESIDARAGTASVRWLRQGRTSTVPLDAISRY